MYLSLLSLSLSPRPRTRGVGGTGGGGLVASGGPLPHNRAGVLLLADLMGLWEEVGRKQEAGVSLSPVLPADLLHSRRLTWASPLAAAPLLAALAGANLAAEEGPLARPLPLLDASAASAAAAAPGGPGVPASVN